MTDSESCCAQASGASLTVEEAEAKAALFKALADPVRLRLLSLIASAQAGEACACDLNDPLERSQATVSHHLSVLVAAGFIQREQRGKWAWFRVAPERRAFVRAMLEGSTDEPVEEPPIIANTVSIPAG